VIVFVTGLEHAEKFGLPAGLSLTISAILSDVVAGNGPTVFSIVIGTIGSVCVVVSTSLKVLDYCGVTAAWWRIRFPPGRPKPPEYQPQPPKRDDASEF
jgi:hypothetical protein